MTQSRLPDLKATEHAFHLLRTELKAERPTNKWQLEAAALKTRQGITGKETRHSAMSTGSRLQAVEEEKCY